MAHSSSSQPELNVYLFARREAILDNWRMACEQDTLLHTVSSLSREEFNDLIPTMLNLFLERLRGEPESASPMNVASEHGLHRWHKGYTLRELLKEVGHLYQGVSNELQAYQQLYPEADVASLIHAYKEVVRISQETTEGSVARYDDLERTAAGSRADTLQEALNQMNELSRQRSDVLRTSSHDLRSSLGVVQGAAFMLDLEKQTSEERGQLMEMLNRNLTNIQTLLQSLMNLARLDAGQDPPEITSFDATELLHELANSVQPLANERHLTLLVDGPAEMIVQSDISKVQRIVQNLLLNAIQYTPTGIISLSWAQEANYRWTVSVQDSGLGIPDTVVQSLSDNLVPFPDSATAIKSRLNRVPDEDITSLPKKVPPGNGEDLNLHIIKRLCELLEASIDIESSVNEGTLIRVRFPIVYRG